MNFIKMKLSYDGGNPNNCDHCGIKSAGFVFNPAKLNLLQNLDCELGFEPINKYRLCLSCDKMPEAHSKFNRIS